jgi:tetratricopeptide (TPR) repeat protein
MKSSRFVRLGLLWAILAFVPTLSAQKTVDDYCDSAKAKYSTGDFDGAIADYDQAIALNPGYAKIYRRRGNAKHAKGDFDGAVADYTKTIELDPNFSSAYNDLAWILATCPEARVRNGSKAVEYATKACELMEWKNAYCLDTLAAADAEAGNFDEAVKWETKCLESTLSKNDAERARRHLGLYQQKKPYHEKKSPITAGRAFVPALSTPKTASEYCDSAKAKYSMGDFAGALADYNKAIAVQPDCAEAYFNRGNTKKAEGFLDDAIDDFDQAIELNPSYAIAYNNRGLTKYAKNDLNGAIADFNKAIEFDASYAGAYNNRGNAKDDKGDIEGAIADYDKVIALNPGSASAYNNRGCAKGEKGDLDGALADYNKVIELDPSCAEAYSNRGNVKKAKGDLDGATADYNQAAALKSQQSSR